ncbi:MAG: saccharopine dehydrogenase NADP-binding domain-containing protein [Chitinophagaceae bacterium]|nr:saccharopine dehydrogenase NADP-binding domain-containing protein [Chitinophagaceae bacterium]MBK7679622.1 saccharopine dehydrogenase NADP-binding domain-containing protein [Chitinophagaceae bacterium]MBK8299025.1 saccharopine dehydrogenase NADP-binding domain-containing protein [Chitinophagaceae bacterium]MBL0068117.1 saccharopine dehydrogenase NADP-binding domain-containing protein [Chitinophagaceae bacterium]MBP6234118.1 saccharopine dehydrogenase NADP-binding domain-containing protein [C
MKTILLFGAGKSATVLIDYLLENSIIENWKIVVVDADLKLAQTKIGGAQRAMAISFDINDTAERNKHIRHSDIVISLLPPDLHIRVAESCIEAKKNLLTASYVDDAIRNLQSKIKSQNLFFLYEMGLDPGIDHMSAMKIIDEIHAKDGKVTSFQSHCGGLVAPESDDNPWHYKISWNPRNIIMAGKAGAHYRQLGEEKRIPYEKLFTPERIVEIPGLGHLSWYPNRDSLGYTPLYGLEDAPTFIRTTLRHPDFMYGWKNIIDLKLIDEIPQYETDGKSLQEVFKEHMDKNGFGEWLTEKLTERFAETKSMMENLLKLMEAENAAEIEGAEMPESFMAADEKGNIEEVEIDKVKNKAAAYLAQNMHEANLTLKQLFFLGLDDQDTLVNKGFCSPADILQFAVEKKLALRPYDKDMIVMLHEIEYRIGSQESTVRSSLVVKGENSLRTAMAKTVGLPLGIAAKHILNGKIKMTGLHIPTSKEIYEPVLAELEKYEVKFTEEKK